MDFLDNATLWVGISFLIFIGLIIKPLVGSTKKKLGENIETIEKKLKEAKSIQDEASHLLSQYKTEKSKIDEKINLMINNAKLEASNIEKDMKLNIKNTISKKEKDFDQKIKQVKLKIEKEISSEILKAATDVTKLRILKDLSDDKNDNIIRKSINEIKLKIK